MKYKQYIQNYKEDYKKYKKWLKKETDHYVFYYMSNPFIKGEINKIAKIQEAAHKKICEVLGIKKTKKITYYIYPDEKSKSKFMGNLVYGQSVYNDNSVHIVYNKKIRPIGPHEDTHLISLRFGLPTSFFAEGLAEAIANKKIFNGKSRRIYLKNWFKKYNKQDLSRFFTQKGWLNTPNKEGSEFYSIAMSFVTYLIKIFGKKSFLKFYGKINRNMTSKQIIDLMKTIFKKDYKEIVSGWNVKK